MAEYARIIILVTIYGNGRIHIIDSKLVSISYLFILLPRSPSPSPWNSGLIIEYSSGQFAILFIAEYSRIIILETTYGNGMILLFHLKLGFI